MGVGRGYSSAIVRSLMYHSSPHTTLRHSVYEFRYSARIVEEFVEKYSRATIFVAKILGVDCRALKYGLINTFQRNNALWNILRDSIKRIDQHNMYADIGRLDDKNRKKYLTYVKFMVTDDWLYDIKSHYRDLTRIHK